MWLPMEREQGLPLVAQTIKKKKKEKSTCNVGETWVPSLSGEDPLEEGMATHSTILAWRIPIDRGAWWATVWGVSDSRIRLTTQTARKALARSLQLAETS